MYPGALLQRRTIVSLRPIFLLYLSVHAFHHLSVAPTIDFNSKKGINQKSTVSKLKSFKDCSTFLKSNTSFEEFKAYLEHSGIDESTQTHLLPHGAEPAILQKSQQSTRRRRGGKRKRNKECTNQNEFIKLLRGVERSKHIEKREQERRVDLEKDEQSSLINEELKLPSFEDSRRFLERGTSFEAFKAHLESIDLSEPHLDEEAASQVLKILQRTDKARGRHVTKSDVSTALEELKTELESIRTSSEQPRLKNAQVVILRKVGTNFHVLLQRRSYKAKKMPGYLATVGGKRDSTDQDSSVTAVREVAEETGLTDIWCMRGAPPWVLHSLVRSSARLPPPPQDFVKFDEGNNVDWWVLLLHGSGTFLAPKDPDSCADIAPLLPKLPGAVLAPCFGHAWVPLKQLKRIHGSLQCMSGMRSKIYQALAKLRDRKKGVEQKSRKKDESKRAP